MNTIRVNPLLLALALALALALSGCASEGEQAEILTVSTDTVAGVVHVSNAGVPEHWVARPIFTVGSVEGDVQFGRIMSITADADGFVYVADGMESRVLVFDSSGTPTTAFGRQGEGPGEFRDLYSVALLGDTLVTLDPRAARLGLFDRGGTWLGMWRHQPLSGNVRLEGVAEDEVYNPIVIPRGRTIDRAYVRLTHAGPSDTITLPGRDERAERSGVTCFGGDGGIHFNANPFAGRELIRAAGWKNIVLGRLINCLFPRLRRQPRAHKNAGSVFGQLCCSKSKNQGWFLSNPYS